MRWAKKHIDIINLFRISSDIVNERESVIVQDWMADLKYLNDLGEIEC